MPLIRISGWMSYLRVMKASIVFLCIYHAFNLPKKSERERETKKIVYDFTDIRKHSSVKVVLVLFCFPKIYRVEK